MRYIVELIKARSLFDTGDLFTAVVIFTHTRYFLHYFLEKSFMIQSETDETESREITRLRMNIRIQFP